LAVPTTAFGITDDMGPGWNLGNTLESTGGETGWGNIKTTQVMIDTVRHAGFRTVRVPVRWDEYLSGTGHTISTAWMDRVEQVVNYVLKDSMYAIVNIHHNNGWEDPSAANAANSQDYVTKIWAQVAARFQKYDNHVIFETMNEPKVGNDWSGKAEYYTVVNQLNAAALAVIRGTGGNNAKRLVMMPGYAANNDSRMSYMVVPKDSMVAVSVHSYDPQDLCLTSPGVTTFTETAMLDKMFALVSTTVVKKGIPVVLGEWASLNKNNLAERAKHAAYFSKDAKAVRIPTILWDNGGTGTNGMGYLTRSKPAFAFPTIFQAIMDAQGTTSIQQHRSEIVQTGLRISRSANGIRFTGATTFDRFVLTGVDGRAGVPAGSPIPGSCDAESANFSEIDAQPDRPTAATMAAMTGTARRRRGDALLHCNASLPRFIRPDPLPHVSRILAPHTPQR
jgi:endoglucanase